MSGQDMNCHDARELFSAALDGVLAAPERARLDAHVSACVDCRRELEYFEKTLALLHSAEPARAPAGFVDRVLAAARPTPWYRRVLQRAFVPLPVKLPLEAAAVVLVGVISVYVFRGTPELQRAASPPYQPPYTSESKEAVIDKATPRPSAPPPPSRRKELAEEHRASGGREAERDLAKEPPSVAGRAPENLQAQTETLRIPRSSPPAADEGAPAQAAKPPLSQERLDAERGQPERPRDGTERKASSERAAAKSSVAAPAPPPSDVAGRLSATDRDGAKRGLADLIVRLGATEISRAVEPNATIVEVLVSRSAYAEFVAGLGRLGRWVPEREPVELPAQIRIALRITD